MGAAAKRTVRVDVHTPITKYNQIVDKNITIGRNPLHIAELMENYY